MAWILASVLIFWSIPSLAFNVESSDTPILKDRYGIIIKEMSDSSVIYTNKKGKDFSIPLYTICFKESETALKDFIYKNLEDEYECNIREIIVVVFNKKLKIEDVRIADIGECDEPLKCKHKTDYIKAIRKTEECGIKQKKYVYIFSMHHCCPLKIAKCSLK